MLILALTGACIALGYIVFGLTGFGASIVAVPLLAQLIPLKLAVPIMLVMDIVAGLVIGRRQRGQADTVEIRHLIPWIGFGMLAGVTLLVSAPEHLLLLLLGIFAFGQSVRHLVFVKDHRAIAPVWGKVYGLGGGAMTSMFGTGGPVYAMYLARRIADESRRRATATLLTWITALARLMLFAVTGLLIQPDLGTYLLACLPFCLLGLLAGSSLRRRLHVHQLNRLVWVVVGAAGLSLLVRYAPYALTSF
jgi:uncharacterized membrane protein YfcA